MPIYGPVERAWLRYWERRDWLASLGCCTPCAMGLSMDSIARSLEQPLVLPCAQPSWNRGKCIEWARAAWAERTQQQEAKAA